MTNSVKKKVLIIGSYNNNYQRNKVLISIFNSQFDTKEININPKGLKKYFDFLKLIIKHGRKQDYIFLIQPAHKFAFELLFFKLFFSKKKVILDAFTSIYDSFVFDRKLVAKYSIKAIYYYTLDYLLCYIADIIVFDTIEHEKYFADKFKIKKNKHKYILPVSVDLDFYHNIKKSDNLNIFPIDKFNILFYGYYIPLQGIEYIIKAANILAKEKNIRFILIGSGQTRQEINKICKELELNNICFFDRIPFEDLISYIKAADLCLGIFGKTDKAKRVIPNKVLDYMACNKIVISGRSEVMEEFFEDNHDIVYSDMADAEDLAKKILFVYNNHLSLEYIGSNAKSKISKHFSKESLQNKINKYF